MVAWIDCFLYNGEQIVELRLEYLYNSVNKFYIIEGRYTHQGKFKEELFFEKYKDIFKPYMDKIVYLIFEEYNKDSYKLENNHRDFAVDEICKNEVSPYIVSVCDVDEIPPCEIRLDLDKLYSQCDNGTILMNQKMYYYNFHWQASDWMYAYFISDIFLKKVKSFQVCRSNTSKAVGVIHGGWHFSYFMSLNEMKRKMESFCHNELNRDEIKNIDNIYTSIKEGILFFRKNEKLERCDTTTFPELFQKYIKKYSDLQEYYPKLTKKKVAICYYGMTRSTRHVYKSHVENLFSILKSNGIDFDTYIHTWKVKQGNRIWQTVTSIPIDYEEYKLLNPTSYVLDDQDIFTESINFPDYFYKDIYDTVGHCSDGEWLPGLVLNHLCALESQKRVTNMCIDSGNKYDAIIYIRPDVRIQTPFSVDWFNHIKTDSIVIPDSDHWEGLNDRFAIVSQDSCRKYGQRIDEIKEFRKTNGRIVSEKYVKYIITKHFKTFIQIPFKMEIVRPS